MLNFSKYLFCNYKIIRFVIISLTEDQWTNALSFRRENYQEPEVKKAKPKMPGYASPSSMMDIDEMITLSKTARCHKPSSTQKS